MKGDFPEERLWFRGVRRRQGRGRRGPRSGRQAMRRNEVNPGSKRILKPLS